MTKRRLGLLLVIALLAAVLAPAESTAITGMGFGIRAGFVFDYDNPRLEAKDERSNIEPKDLSMFGGHFTLLSISKLSAEVSGEYAYRDYRRDVIWSVGGITDTASVKYKVRDYALFATGRYKLIEGNFGVHLGAGINVHRFTYSSQFPEAIDVQVEIPEGGWHTGFHALVGGSFGLPAIPFRVFGEARVAKINVSGEAAQEATVLGGVTFGTF